MKKGLIALFAVCLLAGCGAGETNTTQPPEDVPEQVPEEAFEDLPTALPADEAYIDRQEVEESEIEDEAVALAASPAAMDIALFPEASGTKTEKNQRAEIDYSNCRDGYVMVRFTGTTSTRLKVRVAGPTTNYDYNLPVQGWVTFPLSDGNGSYKVTVLENTTAKKYASVLAASFDLTLSDEFAPFLRPNQYVDYSAAPNTLAKAKEIIGAETDPLEKVQLVYDFVISNLSYDSAKAATVKSGYLPVLDDVLQEKKGICFDYASLMTGMLRSQGVPCKLVVGYAGTAYHAWINVWTEETGWVDGVIFFDGVSWQRMDPTFASSEHSSEAIMKYIGNGSNYTAKYMY